MLIKSLYVFFIKRLFLFKTTFNVCFGSYLFCLSWYLLSPSLRFKKYCPRIFYFVWETINGEDTVFLEVSSDVTIVDKVFTCEWRRHNRPPLQKFDKIPTRLYFTIYCYGKLTRNKSLFFINTCFRCCQSLKEIVNSIKRPSYPKLYLFIQFIKLAHLISR